MTAENILWIIAITIIALLVAIFQYFFKAKRKSKKTILFAFLRFLSVFTLLLLLVNPQITITTSTKEKPELKILVDHSKSISYLQQEETVNKSLSDILENTSLKEAFDISVYGFGETLLDSTKSKFTQNQSKIQESLTDLQKIHRQPNTPIVLISDGNQTYGQDYSFYKSKYQQPIYSVAVGDTTKVSDLKITTVNTNKYVYLNNEFPIEILTNYTGEQDQNTSLSIFRGEQKVYSKNLTFSKDKKSHFLTPKLKARRVGLSNYSIQLSAFEGEKNKANNSKNVLIETIDEKSSILLVSSITHPDIGALKRTIEGNKRRKLKITKPGQVKALDDAELVILYQPNANFRKVYELCDKSKIPLLTITGKNTDWNFINGLQRNYNKPRRTQVEEVLPELNTNFEIFNTNTFNFNKYPPLESTFGQETLNPPFEALLYKKVANISTTYPLLAFWNTKDVNEAVLFGEGIWKWRAYNYKNAENFENFDSFFGKIIQYLSNKKARKRLNLNYENEYFINNSIVISASYFNKNYEFDTKAQLTLKLSKQGEASAKNIPMLLKGSFYEVDLNNLEAGEYRFNVFVTGSKISSKGGFIVQDFDIEKQFQRSNVEALSKLSLTNNGKLVYPNQVLNLVKELLASEKYKPIVKFKKEKKSLIDWKFLLALLIALFGVEWFLRKYSGLI